MLRLREIELCGFKSFADRTRIPLPGDILVVVGPNGAGKSNVTDAVLWALGEQSAKTLRGHKMQDVIFGGSHRRPSSGMAEVLLTFEDSDGGKIQLGRRLLRTGESNYLMDGRPVRLKDAQEFMMRYAISTQGSFLVEQGRVEALLQASPEERRLIFEEVAGIAHFKENRRTALQKLDSTQANLLRLNDIIAEVETQMSALKRQAAKADRFVRLSEELRERRRIFWGRSFGKLTGQRSALLRDLELLREERQRRETSLAKLQSELEEASVRLSEHESSLAALIQSIHQKELEAERAEQENKRRTESILQSRQRLRQIATDREELGRRAVSAREEAEEQEAECDRLVQAEVQAREAAEEAKRQVEESRAKVEALEASQNALRQKAFAMAQEHSRLAANLARLEEDLRRQGEREKRLQREEEGLAAREASLDEKWEELSARKDALDRRLAEARDDLARTGSTVERLQSELEFAAGALTKAAQAMAASESRVKVLAANEATLRSSAHAFLSARHAERARSTLAEALGGAPDSLVPALSAALSGLLEGYTDNAWAGLDGVLSELRQERAGEAVFFIGERSQAASARPENPRQHKGFLGWLDEAGGLPQSTRSILPLVALTEDAESARRFAMASGIPAVSRDGFFIHPDGWARGGAGGTGGASLLEHQRERARAEEALELDVAANRKAVAEHERIRSDLEYQRTALTEARSVEQTVLQETSTAARDLEILDGERKRLAASRALLEGEAAQAGEERQAWEDQRKELAAELNATDADRTRIDEEVRSGEAALASARQFQEGGHETVAETRAKFSEVSQKLHSAQAARTRALDRAKELQDTERRLAEEAQTLEARVETLTAEMTESDRALRTLLLALDESRQRKAKFEEDLRLLSQDVQSRQQQVKDAREALDQAREEVSRSELLLASVESDLRNLVERMGEVFEEDPGSVAESFADLPPLSEEERQEEHRGLSRLEERINDLGAVNMLAREEYAELTKRFEFLSTQRADLEESVASLQETIRKINRTTRERFMEAFEAVQMHFSHLFKEVFEGGEARLSLLDEANPLDTGVEIYAQPPGKKLQNLQLLSGGEKAMVALALLFSLFRYRPQPFFILDEVDAPLDEANINRFNRLLTQFRGHTQFVVVSHNKRTMEMAEVLYGVTMAEGGVSRVVSVRLADVEERLAAGGTG